MKKHFQNTGVLAYLIGVFILSLMLSCDTKESNDDPPEIEPANGVFVVNEGGFGRNNATLGYYHFETEKYSSEVFKTVAGFNLGDVFQSITLHEDQLYLVVNNSGKIEVIDANTLEYQRTISGFRSPRNLLFVNSEKAYVSDLIENVLYVIQPQSGEVISSISFKGSTENLLFFDHKLYVSVPAIFPDVDLNKIFVVDVRTDLIIDSIEVGYKPGSMVLDDENKLWVYCNGSNSLNEPGGLFQIDIENQNKIYPFLLNHPVRSFSNRLKIDSDKNTLYFLDQDVFAVDLPINELPLHPIIEAKGRNFYGLDIAPLSDDIFVTDVIDYQQHGIIYRYDKNGDEQMHFTGGVIPNGFLFY